MIGKEKKEGKPKQWRWGIQVPLLILVQEIFIVPPSQGTPSPYP
jgi:hypothetical protein